MPRVLLSVFWRRRHKLGATFTKCGTFTRKTMLSRATHVYVRGPRTSETRNIRQKSMFSRATHVYVRGPRTSETRNSRQKSTIPGLLIIILFKRPGTRITRADPHKLALRLHPSRILGGGGAETSPKICSSGGSVVIWGTVLQ